MSISPFAQVAATWYEEGFSFIPILPPDCGLKGAGKAPGQYNKVTKTWQGMEKWSIYGKERKPTQEEVDEWMDWPDAGIGLATGIISGVIAFDFDTDMYGLHKKVKEILPEAIVKKVGNLGYTAIFRYSSEVNKSWKKTINGKSVTILELLSSGRQTVMPPSIHPVGKPYKYTTMDTLTDQPITDLKPVTEKQLRQIYELFAEILEKKMEAQPKKKIDVIPGGVGYSKIYSKYSVPPLEMSAEALSFIPADDYEMWIHIGMGLRDEYGDKAYGIWDKWSTNSAKYQSKGMQAKWNSFNGSGITIATVFKMAMDGGYKLPVDTRFEGLPEVVPMKPKRKINGHTTFEELLYKARNKPKMFPEHLLKPPGILGDIVTWINDTSIKEQPELALGASIAGLGAIYGHKIASQSDLRTNMYCLGVAASGSGKDHARKCWSQLFTMIGQDDLEGGLPASGSGLITALHNSHGRHVLLLDEIGYVMQGLTHKNANPHQSDIMKEILELFSSANKVYKGKSYAGATNKDGKSARKDIQQPCLSIYGTTTPQKFYDSMTSAETADGFLPRFLLFESSNDSPELRDMSLSHVGDITNPPARIISGLNKILTMDSNMYPRGELDKTGEIRPKKIPFTEKAAILMQQFSLLAEEKKLRAMFEGDTRGEDAMWARAQEHAIKLCLIAHQDGKISVEVVQWATELTQCCVTNLCNSLKERVADTQVEKDTKKMMRIMKKNGGELTKALITKRTHFLDKKKRNDILDTLEESGMIQSIILDIGAKQVPGYRVVKE